MEKLVYLIREPSATVGAALRDRLLEAAGRLSDAGAAQIAVGVEDDAVAAGKSVTIGKLEPPIRGMVSWWMDNSDDRADHESILGAAAASLNGYLVVESVPMRNTAHVAAAGQRTPGVNMVTCINRLTGLSDADFRTLWYEEHRRVAVETQATFGYVRNTVVRTLTDGAPAWDGIVEELFPLGALTDQKVWYAADSDEQLRSHQKRMMESVQRFLDLGSIESHPMSQYLLDS